MRRKFEIRLPVQVHERIVGGHIIDHGGCLVFNIEAETPEEALEALNASLRPRPRLLRSARG
jgi:hypothetical protein